MSSALAADGVPPGVAADAFYQKGSGPGSLLQIVEAMAGPERPPPAQYASKRAPIRVEPNSQNSFGAARMLNCPECLRAFPRVSSEAPGAVHEATCVYCDALFCYAIVENPASEGTKAEAED
jgi:hypothetical protein